MCVPEFVWYALMVKNPSGGLALKLLLLQDALKVLHTLFRVFHVSWQVAVQEADGVAKHWHAGAHTTFVSLKQAQAEKWVILEEIGLKS